MEDEKPIALRVRESVMDFTSWLKKLAQDTATLPSANDDEKINLREDADQLARAVDSLIKKLDVYDALHMSMRWDGHQMLLTGDFTSWGPYDPLGLVDLSMALASAFHLGSRVIDNPIMKRRLEDLQKAAKKASVAHARQQKESKSKEYDVAILECAKSLWARRPSLRKSAGATASAILECSNTDQFHGLKKSALEKRLRKLMLAQTPVQSSA
jgi:hypothetical protein